MRAVGVITEYNPFHNGHLYHLQESKKVAQAQVSVAVMSGHFLQRGEPALVDKWQRARMAIAAGVDLVVELPLPWACSSAPDFARGGVLSLAGIGGIDALCFGSETGDLAALQDCARQLHRYESELADKTGSLLRLGVNYPTARAELMASADADYKLMASPNNILGLEYLRALENSKATIKPLTIQRIGAGFHDLDQSSGIASATGIRHLLANDGSFDALMPPSCHAILSSALVQGTTVSDTTCFRLIAAQIYREQQNLADYWLVSGGIENRLCEAADKARTLSDLITGIKVRQLTRTRIQRMLSAILLGWKVDQVKPLLGSGPKYLHLLGASRTGEQFLAQTRKQRSLPLIQNFSRIYASLKKFYGVDSLDYEFALAQLQMELTATRIYQLLLKAEPEGKQNRDFYQDVVRGD